MARKPVDIIAAAARPEGRQVVWQAIRKLRTFTVADLEHETRISEKTIRTYVRGLERADYLKKIGKQERAEHVIYVSTNFVASIYRLEKDVGIEAPRVTRGGQEVTQGRAREQMWRTMRVLRDFNFRDLAVQASIEEVMVDEENARNYIVHLHRAGYLHITQPSRPGHKPGTGTPARYRLIPSKYSGPHAPQIQRVKQVFDPNVGRVVWWSKGGDA